MSARIVEALKFTDPELKNYNNELLNRLVIEIISSSSGGSAPAPSASAPPAVDQKAHPPAPPAVDQKSLPPAPDEDNGFIPLPILQPYSVYEEPEELELPEVESSIRGFPFDEDGIFYYYYFYYYYY
jgi:hypothetical protein